MRRIVLLSPVILTVLVVGTGYLTIKSTPARKLIEGEPLVMVQNGKIYEENMRKIRYNLDDLLMQLREKGVFDLSEVETAVLEPHGQLSVLKKSQQLPVTPKDLNIPTKYKGLSSEIIRDGYRFSWPLYQQTVIYTLTFATIIPVIFKKWKMMIR